MHDDDRRNPVRQEIGWRPKRALSLILALTAAGCQRPTPPAGAGGTTLRIAISSGRTSTSAPDFGLAQIKQNLSLESLATFGDDGRPRPSVAESWTVSEDRRVVMVRLRAHVQYQDGSPVTSADIAAILNRTLPRAMGPAFEDIESVRASSDRDVEIRFRRPSGFRLEILEVTIQKPGKTSVGTGPFTPTPGAANELSANEHYYLGKPHIARINIASYPSFRSAWADMLRNRNDMLYEVGVDALDSLRNANTVARVFSYLKRYQFLIVLNTTAPALESRAVRQALNYGVDRSAIVRDALNGFGVASDGPVSPLHWAMSGAQLPRLTYDVSRSAKLLATAPKPVQFKCLVMADYERLALVIKRQLEMLGVEMDLEEVTPDQLLARVSRHDFDAFLVDMIGGPTMLRLYLVWHSGAPRNVSGFKSDSVDAALDAIRHSASDDEYRVGVERLQRTMLDDPPAIFLAWSEGARAVSSRFEVPTEPDRPDPMGTLRLWRPAIAPDAASRN